MCALPQESVVLPQKFFFFIGVIKPRKNVFNIVRAFDAFCKTISTHHLVIAGSGGGEYYDSIRQYVSKCGLKERVHFLGFLSNNEVSFVYRRAEALVFPTLIEGFGYPVLEAMDCGIPVITSNLSSLKEIGEGAAVLVNPYDVAEIGKAMVSIAIDKVMRQDLIRKGFERAEKFSWKKSGAELKKLAESLL